jgi:hypothetical protein
MSPRKRVFFRKESVSSTHTFRRPPYLRVCSARRRREKGPPGAFFLAASGPKRVRTTHTCRDLLAAGGEKGCVVLTPCSQVRWARLMLGTALGAVFLAARSPGKCAYFSHMPWPARCRRKKVCVVLTPPHSSRGARLASSTATGAFFLAVIGQEKCAYYSHSQAKTRSMVLKRSSKIAGSKRCLRPRFGVLRPRGFSGMLGTMPRLKMALRLAPQS